MLKRHQQRWELRHWLQRGSISFCLNWVWCNCMWIIVKDLSTLPTEEQDQVPLFWYLRSPWHYGWLAVERRTNYMTFHSSARPVHDWVQTFRQPKCQHTQQMLQKTVQTKWASTWWILGCWQTTFQTQFPCSWVWSMRAIGFICDFREDCFRR